VFIQVSPSSKIPRTNIGLQPQLITARPENHDVAQKITLEGHGNLFNTDLSCKLQFHLQ
jgi:hypothetical protein